MSLCILTNAYTDAYKYTVVRLDDLGTVSSLQEVTVWSTHIAGREGRGRPEHKHTLYESTDASLSLF